jgi:uncharacterized protein with NRDE domain
MCTLIALHRCTPGAYLWIAANRDEFLNRPAEGPALREWRGKPVVAPLDRQAGGTWWGLNGDGVFAALTNRPAPTPDPTRRSRGLLVADALGWTSARDAAAALEALPAATYNPFNLFVADRECAFAVVYDERPVLWPLDPGVHVIGNADPNARDVAKIRRTLERAEGVRAADDEKIAMGLEAICRTHDHGADPLGSPCVHHGGYGTRSSALLRLGTSALLRHADGPPCTVPYRDLTPLLEELDKQGERVSDPIHKMATRKAS